MKPIEELSRVAPEMLAGLSADAAMRQRILSAQAPLRSRMLYRLAPVAVAGLVLVGGATALLRGGNPAGTPGTMPIEIHAAGTETAGAGLVASLDVPNNSVQIHNNVKVSQFHSLFASGSDGNFPLVGFGGNVYRLMTAPGSLSSKALGDSLGTVELFTDEPSLADPNAWYGLLSNAAAEGTEVRAVSGLSTDTAIAAQVDDEMRLFQRASYAGFGPGGGSLADVLNVRGNVASLDLSGVGVIEDSAAANALMSLLLDNAVFQSNDSSRGNQALNIRLKGGLTLQLLVSGNTFSACGSWSCAEFLDAFKAALPIAEPIPEPAPVVESPQTEAPMEEPVPPEQPID